MEVRRQTSDFVKLKPMLPATDREPANQRALPRLLRALLWVGISLLGAGALAAIA